MEYEYNKEVQLMPERYRDAYQQKLRRARLTGKSSLLGKTMELHGFLCGE